MWRTVSLVALLVLGPVWTLQAVLEPPILTQESFELGQFMGQWYEVAVVSTCPHYMQRRRVNPVIVALELQHVTSEGNFTMTATSLRNGSCKQMSTVYSLTNTPGQFFHHVARLRADVDSFVVQTDYDEYAMMLLMSTEKPSGNKTTIVKLYSRSMNASAAALGDFRNLVRQHGMNDDHIIMNQNKGECVPHVQTTKLIQLTQPQTLVLERQKRNVLKPLFQFKRRPG